MAKDRKRGKVKELFSKTRGHLQTRYKKSEDSGSSSGRSIRSSEFISSLRDIKMVGRYEIIQALGHGGTGAVYLGRDPYIKRNVAIKISQQTSDKSREKFFVEAQSAGRLNHPNIVSIFDAGIYRDYCYITMEYVEGVTLEKYCKKDNLLPVTRVLEHIFNVCNALEYAHKQGVIHRDIKPSNIMINKNGAIKITDFGIAQMIEETAKIGIYGTPGYMSPEQLKETIATGQSDIFSVGCVMYELLTGQKAFTGKNLFSIMYKIINEEPESILTLRPELPEVLDEIIKKALAKEVKDRYQNCTEMAYYIRMALRTISGAVKKEKDIVEIIHNVPFFRHFTKDQVRELVAASEILKAISGKMIVSEGDIDDTFFIILSGKAQVMKNGNKVASIGVGECFGEMSYIANQARSASVVAETDCILMKISATLLNKSSESIQLLFFKNFAMTLVRRLSASAEKKK